MIDCERIKREVMDDLEYWLPQLANGAIQGVQIDIHGYRGPGEQVRSLGRREPQRKTQLTRVKLTA